MNIIRLEQVNPAQYGLCTACSIHILHVVIDDVQDKAAQMISLITDTSWISNLSAIDRISYSARAQRTIDKLVNQIFSKVETKLSVGFGEYMVSMTAQDVLENSSGHTRVPLAELFKERVTGNSGFDFHTETNRNLIAFGEAKYSGRQTPYMKAITQMCEFVDIGKDAIELADLKHFVTQDALTNFYKGSKAFIAAFSINATRADQIFSNLLKCSEIEALLQHTELYLIGVEVASD